MTKQWYQFWRNENNSETINKLNSIFETNITYLAQAIGYQLNIKKNNVVAEFGCGYGDLLSFMEKSQIATIGIDFSEDCINNNKTNKSLLLLNDSFNVELKNESVDRSFCYGLFNYLNIDECMATLEEMLRITKTGGFILCGNIINKEKSDTIMNSLYKIKTPQINIDMDKKVLTKIAEALTSDRSMCVVYDNDIIGYENSKNTLNLLIWKL